MMRTPTYEVERSSGLASAPAGWRVSCARYRYLGFPGGLASRTDEILFISPTATAEGRIYNEEPNSLNLDCGKVLGGPRADSHIVQFVIVTIGWLTKT